MKDPIYLSVSDIKKKQFTSVLDYIRCSKCTEIQSAQHDRSCRRALKHHSFIHTEIQTRVASNLI